MVMILALGTLAVASGSMLVAIVRGLQKAPEAYEDERGFNIIQERPRRSQILVLKPHAKAPGSGTLKPAQVRS